MLPYSYQRAQLNLFYDLVLQANPNVPWSLNDNSKLGTPAVLSPAVGIADTKVLVRGVNHFVANVTARYRRIDVGSLFKNFGCVITSYSSGNTLSKDDAIAQINKTYGTSFVSADFGTFTLTSGVANTQTVVASSLCYKGTFQITWTKDKQALSSVVPVKTALTGRLYPGGNTFDGSRKKQGEYFCYDLGFNLLTSYFSGLTTGTLDYTNATHKTIIDYLTANVSSRINGGDHTTDGGLNGLAFAKYALPNANVLEANSAKYGNAFVITAQSTSWFQGKIILHFS